MTNSANALLIAAARDVVPVPADIQARDDVYLQRAAEWQGLGALLHDWLGRHPDVMVALTTRRSLEALYWSEHFRNRQLIAELRAIQRAAADAGVDVMALKGARLATDFYRTPALRPMSDLDLLVRPHHVESFRAVLRSRGYAEVPAGPSYVDVGQLDEQSREHCWFIRRPDLEILIEFRVTPFELAVGRLTDFDGAYHALMAHETARVWERSSVGPEGVRLMAPEDLLFHVATHMAAKHLHFRLIWLVDLARIAAASSIDWHVLARMAGDLRVVTPVCAALDAARRYAAAPITDHALALVRGGGARSGARSARSIERRQLERCLDALPMSDLSREGPCVWPLAAALSRVRGVAARMRVVRWVLFPGRAYLAQRGQAGRTGLAGLARRVAARLSSRRP